MRLVTGTVWMFYSLCDSANYIDDFRVRVMYYSNI